MSEIPSKFSFAGRVKSFEFAFKGLWFVVAYQDSSRLHLAATIAVCSLAVFLNLSVADWKWLVATIFIVWFSEAINTAFEYVCDVVSPEFNSSVEKAKDIAAGAVLIVSIGAAIMGGLIFWPYLPG